MKKSLVFLVLLNAIVSSCIEDIPINIDTHEEVIVNCILQNTEFQTLTLVYSKPINGGLYYEPVQEADIEFYKNDTLVGQFNKQGSRTWEILHLPQPSSNYQIVITIPNRDKIKASTTMPNESSILYVSETIFKKRFVQKDQIKAQWVFALNSEFDERWENPFEVPKINSYDMLIESIATNHPAADRFNQNGNLGDLIGEESSLPAYDFYIRLNSCPDSIIFDIEANFASTCFVVFRNTSYEYDQYLKSSFQKMQIYSDIDDPGAWFDENEIYSNVENGVGIFGAYTDTILVFGNLKMR